MVSGGPAVAACTLGIDDKPAIHAAALEAQLAAFGALLRSRADGQAANAKRWRDLLARVRRDPSFEPLFAHTARSADREQEAVRIFRADSEDFDARLADACAKGRADRKRTALLQLWARYVVDGYKVTGGGKTTGGKWPWQRLRRLWLDWGPTRVMRPRGGGVQSLPEDLKREWRIARGSDEHFGDLPELAPLPIERGARRDAAKRRLLEASQALFNAPDSDEAFVEARIAAWVTRSEFGEEPDGDEIHVLAATMIDAAPGAYQGSAVDFAYWDAFYRLSLNHDHRSSLRESSPTTDETAEALTAAVVDTPIHPGERAARVRELAGRLSGLSPASLDMR